MALVQGSLLQRVASQKSPMLRWLRSSYAASTILAGIFLFNNFLTGFLFSSSTLAQDPAINVHLSDFLVGASGAVTLLLLKSRFKLQVDGLYRYRQVALMWSASSLSATVIPLSAERILSGQPLKSVRITGIPYGMESYVAQFALFTILVAGISEMRRASTSLAIARHKLQEIQRNLSVQLKGQRAELEAQVASQIDPVLAELQTVVAGLDDSSREGVQEAIPKLKSAIDDVIRPLSHSLALSIEHSQSTQDSVASVAELRKEISRMSLRERWLSRIPLGASFDPVLGPLVFAMFVMPSVGYLDSIASALLVCVPAVAFISASSLGLNLALSRIELPYVLVNIFGAITNAAFSLFFIGATMLAPNALPYAVVVGLAIGVGLLLSISGYFGLVIERRVRFLTQANDANIAVGQQASRTRHEIVILKRQIGRLIHGGVQAKLQAAMLRLARATTVDSELLNDVSSDIEDARRMLERIEAPVPIALGELLDDVIDFWAGACDVNVEISRELDEKISKDPIAVQCVIEIIREAVTNAVKHGQASDVTVSVSFAVTNGVKILVQHDEGSESELPKISSGLGSHIYDELSSHWSLSKAGQLVTLAADVNVSA